MKVLVLTSLFPNPVNPVHSVFVRERMFAYARRTGAEVRVVAPVPYFPRWKRFPKWFPFSQIPLEERQDGRPVYHPRYFVLPGTAMSLHGFSYYLSILPLLKRIRSEFPFDLIDSHYFYPDGFAAVLLGRKLGVPVSVSARGTDLNLFPKFPIVRAMIRKTIRDASVTIAVSESLRSILRTLGADERRSHTLPNGVDAEKFHRIGMEDARRHTGLSPGKTIILSIGNLTPSKGFGTLLEAFRILSQQDGGNRDLELVILGEGEDRPRLEKMASVYGIRERVRMPGRIPHSELILWYNSADIFCLASEREGWPNVIQEAIACGVPVVATPVGGIPEILGEQECGILSAGPGTSELAYGLHAALSRNWDRDGISRYGRGRSWDSVADRLDQIFRSIAGRPH